MFTSYGDKHSRTHQDREHSIKDRRDLFDCPPLNHGARRRRWSYVHAGEIVRVIVFHFARNVFRRA